jgi:hypothetical protein
VAVCGQCSVATMMAVCGASSVLSRSSFPYECIDPCTGASPVGLQTSVLCWGITATLESEASSCLSANMGNSNDPEDSGASSQPPPWNSGDGQQTEVAPTSQPESLDITVPSSNDVQESGGVSQGQVDTSNRGNMVQNASTLQVVHIMKDEGSEYLSKVHVKQEDFPGAGRDGIISPPRKRLCVESPSGYTLQERFSSQEVEASPRQHSSPTTSNIGTTQDVSGRWKESGHSSSSHSGEQPNKGGQQQLWWLTPRSSPAEQPQQPTSKNVEGRDSMGELAFDGGGQRSTAKETDFLFKSPTYDPYMLNALDSKQGITGSQTVVSSLGGSLTAKPNAKEHPFLPPWDGTSARVGGSNMVANLEDSSRAANLFPGSRVAGGHGLCITSRHEAHDASMVNASGSLERHHSLPGSAQPVGLESTAVETRGTRGLQLPIGNSHGNAITNFQGHTQGTMPLGVGALQAFPSRGFSQAGPFPNATEDPLSFSMSMAGLSSTGHPNAGQAPQYLERNLQKISKDMIACSLQANAQSSIPVPTFMSSLQSTDTSHMNVPDLSSVELLQLMQRSADCYPRHTLPQGIGNSVSDFQFSSARPASEYRLLPTELNLSQPAQGNHTLNWAQRPEDGFGTEAGDLARNHGHPKSLQLDLSFPARPAPPSVTAVMDGRSIGQRVCLHDYSSYESFARAMRKMFEDCIPDEDLAATEQELHLGNAIPGYVIAYEDEERDLLLAGDLAWR